LKSEKEKQRLQREQLIEAALFMAGRTMTVDELHSVTKLRRDTLRKLLEGLSERWKELGTALEIVETEDGWKMRVCNEFLPFVHSLSSLTDLTEGELKTLAVVAYYQPITQADIVKIRGNRAYEHLSRMEGLGLVTREPSGVTKIVTTTSRFKDYFGEVDAKNARDLLTEKEKPELPSEEELVGAPSIEEPITERDETAQDE